MFTRDEILREYAKCLSSPVYAVETFLETFDKTQEGFVPFNLFPRQKEIIFAYEKHRFNLITKPRQAGVSTTTAAYLAIKASFADIDNPEAVLIIANKQELAFEFLAKIKDFVSQLPRWVWGPEYYGDSRKEEKTIFLKDSIREIKLPNGSRIKAVATSKDALRGFTPTYLVMDEAAYIDDGAIVFGAALTALGCLTKDSLILTNNGLVELNELVREKEKLGFTELDTPHIVCNKDGLLTPATQTFVSEYGETYRIKTKLGIELEGSWKHPLLIDKNGVEEWVKMEDIVVGDKPVLQYGQQLFGNSGIFEIKSGKERHLNQKNVNIPIDLSKNLDFSYLLGLFVAEGNFTSGGISITNTDKYIIDFLVSDTAKLGNPFKKVNEKHYMFHSTELLAWFSEFGLEKHNARDKEIPLPILKMPKEVVKNFLQGMFDGDGMSTVKEIGYSSTSKKLINTLQVLLLNFGIVSHIKKEIQKTSASSILSNKNHICTIYNLKIYSNYAIKFYEEIGFRLERKQIKKERLLKLRDQISNNEKFYIDEIVSISKSNDYTYDLHVPETNSFISNGMISHNTGGKATLISTPNGMDKLYYETYAQSKALKNNFNIIEMKWYEDLRYNKDLKWIKGDEVIEETEFSFDSYSKMIEQEYKPTSSWYEEMCRGMNNNAQMIAQELDVSFIGSGGNVIDEKEIDRQTKLNVQDPIIVRGGDSEIWIWKEPEEGHQYILSCDVSRGDGEDSSTIVIVDFTTMEEVMEYQGHIQPDLLAQIVEEYGDLYKAYTIVDITGGMGVSTVLKLIEFGYKRLHYDTLNSKILSSKQKQMESFKKDDKVPGLQVSGIRLQMIANFEEKVRNNIIKIRSIRMVSEMKTFVYKNGRPDHMDGYHDDLLMAMAMALWVLEHSFKNLERLEKQTKAMLSSWITPNNASAIIDQRMVGQGFVSKENRNKIAAKRPNFSPIVGKNMQDPTGQYMWLFSGSK